MRLMVNTIIIITITLFCFQSSYSQIVAPVGETTRASSQLVYYYNTTDNPFPELCETLPNGQPDPEGFCPFPPNFDITLLPLFFDFDSKIQVTNTSDTDGVWIHVKVFRSYDPDFQGDILETDCTISCAEEPGDEDPLTGENICDIFDEELQPIIPPGCDDPTNGNEVRCEERNFVDFLTPNDTHVYDLDAQAQFGELVELLGDIDGDEFPLNMGESASAFTETAIIEFDDSVGFVVITPVVSESDLSAISFQHLVGGTKDISVNSFRLNAMGRDAVDYTTGEIVPDGTPLDGVNNGFVVIQPEEMLLGFEVFNLLDDVPDIPPAAGPISLISYIGRLLDNAEIASFSFSDVYGEAGLQGYQVIPGDATWNSFLYDFRENPVSCGFKDLQCTSIFGINEDVNQETLELGMDLLCPGTQVRAYPDTFDDVSVLGDVGYIKTFVSGLDIFENHFAMFYNDDVHGAEWFHGKGERTEVMPPEMDEDCSVEGDEDEDGFADCLDSDCATAEECETGAEECADGMDNDEDTKTDCLDEGCDGFAGCEFGSETSCEDGIDNDGDGDTDGDDSDCQDADTGDGGGGNGGCTVASAVTVSTAAANFLLPLLPLAGAYGYRRLRRRNSK